MVLLLTKVPASFDAETMVRAIARHHCNTVYGTAKQILELANHDLVSKLDMSKLKRAVIVDDGTEKIANSQVVFLPPFLVCFLLSSKDCNTVFLDRLMT